MKGSGSLFLKWLTLFIAPLGLAVLEYWHPYGFSNETYHQLAPRVNWWIYLHLIQALLFPLAGLGVFFLIREHKGFDAAVAKISLFLFAVAYTVYDAAAGIGLGNLIRQIKALPLNQQEPLEKLVQAYFLDPYLGGMNSWLSQFASWTWLVAVIAVVSVLYRAKKPFLPLILLLLSGIYLWMSHAYPNGPIAFACLFFANIWLRDSYKES